MSIMERLSAKAWDSTFDPGSFSSGNEQIDNILRYEAGVLAREHKAVTHLFFLDGNFVGFCSLLADSVSVVRRKLFPDGSYPSHYPCVHLYAIGVDKRCQSKGIGSFILQWVLGTAKEISLSIGVKYVVLEAFSDEKLIRFYDRFRFEKWRYQDDVDDLELVPMVFEL